MSHSLLVPDTQFLKKYKHLFIENEKFSTFLSQRTELFFFKRAVIYELQNILALAALILHAKVLVKRAVQFWRVLLPDKSKV